MSTKQTGSGEGTTPTAMGTALKGAQAVRAAAEKRIDEILEEAARGLFANVGEAGRLAVHLTSDDPRLGELMYLEGIVDGAEVADKLEGREPRRPAGKAKGKPASEALAAKGDDKPAATAGGSVVPGTSPANDGDASNDESDNKPRRRGKRGGKGRTDGGQQADALTAIRNPNNTHLEGNEGDRPQRRDDERRPAPRRNDLDDRPRRPFVVVPAAFVRPFVALLRRPAPMKQIVVQETVAVDKAATGETSIVVRRNGDRFEIVLPALEVSAVADALEFGLPGRTGVHTSVEFNEVKDAKVEGLAARGPSGPRRDDDRPRPQRDDREPSGDRPQQRDDRPAPRRDDQQAQGPAPSLRTPGKPGARNDVDTPRPPRRDGDDRKPSGDRPQRGGDRRPAPPVRFPKGFVEAAAEAVAAFLAGDEAVTGIPVTEGLLHFGKVEKLEIGEDGFIRPDAKRRSGWSYDNCRAAMMAAYSEGHPLAAMMTLPGREPMLSDLAIPARMEGTTLVVLPFTRDAIGAIPKEAVERARADIAAAPSWVAHLRNAANRGWHKGIGAMKTFNIRTVRKDGSGIDVESILNAFGRVCSIKHPHKCDAATTAVTAFGRCWAACPAGALGFARALRQVAGEQAASKGLAALDGSAGVVVFDDVIGEWPIAGNAEERKWLPRNEEEADSRLRNDGPHVWTDARSYGLDALTRVWERELPCLLVVQDGDDERVWQGFALSRESAETFVKAGLAEMNTALKVNEDVVTFLVDREGALERPPLPLEGKRKKAESKAARKAADEADKERSDRWRADQRAMRVVVAARLLGAYAYVNSAFYAEHVLGVTEDDNAVADGEEPAGVQKARRSGAPKKGAGGPHARRKADKRTGGGDSPNDPALDARLAKAARKGGGQGGPTLPAGLGGSGTPVPKRGAPVAKAKEKGGGKKG